MKKGVKRRLFSMALAFAMMAGMFWGIEPLEVRAQASYHVTPLTSQEQLDNARWGSLTAQEAKDLFNSLGLEQDEHIYYFYTIHDSVSYKAVTWYSYDCEAAPNAIVRNPSPNEYEHIFLIEYYEDPESETNPDSTPKEKKSTPYVPPTPKELQAIALTEAYPNGWEFMKMGSADVFMDFGQDGSLATIWQAGNKLMDFSLKDANGAPVKMTYLGIKTFDDGTKYMDIMAYSRAGGLTFNNLTEEEIGKLKEAGLSGIMIQGMKYNW